MRATPSAPKPSARACATSSRLAAVRSIESGPVMVLHPCQYNQLMALPIALYSSSQVRALDAHAIDVLGIPGYTLMKRAGEAALRHLRSRLPVSHRIVIVCGGGNNGGDGYVLARFAQAAGLTVSAVAATPAHELRGDARHACDDYRASGGQVQPFSAAVLGAGEVIVDALLGTGLAGALRAATAEVIREINRSRRPVFALDVPSGLDSDAGVALGDAVRADSTVTFVGMKTGLLVGDGPEYAGTVFFDDLESCPRVRGAVPAAPHAHHRGGDPRGAAAPAPCGAQRRLRPGADHRQRQRHARRDAPGGRGVPAGRCRAHHRSGGPRERGGHRGRTPGAHLPGAQ